MPLIRWWFTYSLLVTDAILATLLPVLSGHWRDIRPSVSPSPRYGFVSGVSGGYYYIAAGEGPNGLYLNDIWRFHIG